MPGPRQYGRRRPGEVLRRGKDRGAICVYGAMGHCCQTSDVLAESSGLAPGSHTDQPRHDEPRYPRPPKRRRASRHRKDMDTIPSHLHSALAEPRVDDLRRAAVAHNLTRRQGEPGQPVAVERSVTLRFGSPADEKPLARLAALDSSKPPAQPVLLAEVDGQLHAALGLSDGTVVADPFHPTADLIDLHTRTSPPARGQQPNEAFRPSALTVSIARSGLALGKYVRERRSDFAVR